jgi:hypothetical protein
MKSSSKKKKAKPIARTAGATPRVKKSATPAKEKKENLWNNWLQQVSQTK